MGCSVCVVNWFVKVDRVTLCVKIDIFLQTRMLMLLVKKNVINLMICVNIKFQVYKSNNRNSFTNVYCINELVGTILCN